MAGRDETYRRGLGLLLRVPCSGAPSAVRRRGAGANSDGAADASVGAVLHLVQRLGVSFKCYSGVKVIGVASAVRWGGGCERVTGSGATAAMGGGWK